MKLDQALKKSSTIKRASKQNEVYDLAKNPLNPFSKDDLLADDWMAEIKITKWIGSRAPKETPKK